MKPNWNVKAHFWDSHSKTAMDFDETKYTHPIVNRKINRKQSSSPDFIKQFDRISYYKAKGQFVSK